MDIGAGRMSSDLPLTSDKHENLLESWADEAEARKEQVLRYCLIEKKSVREAAEQLGISKSQVYRNLQGYRQEYLKCVRKDLRRNRRILDHMVGLMVQVDARTGELWDHYEVLTQDVILLKNELMASTASAGSGEARSIRKLILGAKSRQLTILSLLRQETRTMLQIWYRFGLCGNDAMQVLLTDGVDVEQKIQEIKGFMSQIFDIIKEEVNYEDVRAKIFGRMADAIKARSFLNADDEFGGC